MFIYQHITPKGWVKYFVLRNGKKTPIARFYLSCCIAEGCPVIIKEHFQRRHLANPAHLL